MTQLDIARSYIARGWNPVPVKYRDKKPSGGDGWQHCRIDDATAPEHFNGAPMNIGVQMGPKSNNLRDVDLDCPAAIVIAPYVLPKTDALFGRASARSSHWLYVAEIASDKATEQFKIPRTPKVFLECRIGGGDKGAQTVFPGSTHESGEAIQWEPGCNGDPAKVVGEALMKAVHRLAALSLVAMNWPAEGGRHQAALVLGGFLARAGLTPIETRTALEAVARAAHDEEWKNRRADGEDAAKAFLKGKNTYGFPALTETFGNDVAWQVADWLDFDPLTSNQDRDTAEPSGERSDPETGEVFEEAPKAESTANGHAADDEPAAVKLLVRFHGQEGFDQEHTFFVYNTIPETGGGILAGQWGTYKTFAAIDLAAAAIIATIDQKQRFCGEEIDRPGGVLMFVTEGESEISERLDAALQYRGWPEGRPAPFGILTLEDMDLNLSKPNSVDALIVQAKLASEEMQRSHGVPLVLIIVDTAVNVTGFTKENQGNDEVSTTIVNRALRRIGKESGSFCYGVEHFGKAVETGTRGSSAKESTAYSVLATLGDKSISGNVVNPRLAVRKVKGGINGREYRFTPVSVPTGKFDRKGRSRSTLVLEWIAEDGAGRQPAAPKGPKSALIALRALQEAIDGLGAVPPASNYIPANTKTVTAEEWRTYAYAGGISDGGPRSKQKAFRAAWDHLLATSQIGVWNEQVWMVIFSNTQP